LDVTSSRGWRKRRRPLGKGVRGRDPLLTVPQLWKTRFKSLQRERGQARIGGDLGKKRGRSFDRG